MSTWATLAGTCENGPPHRLVFARLAILLSTAVSCSATTSGEREPHVVAAQGFDDAPFSAPDGPSGAKDLAPHGDPREKSSAREWWAKARGFEQRGSYDDAIHCYTQATALDPEFTDAWRGLGIRLFERGRFTEALECFTHADSSDRQKPDILIFQALTLSKLGRFEEAIRLFQRMPQNARLDDSVLREKARALAALGDYLR